MMCLLPVNIDLECSACSGKLEVYPAGTTFKVRPHTCPQTRLDPQLEHLKQRLEKDRCLMVTPAWTNPIVCKLPEGTVVC